VSVAVGARNNSSRRAPRSTRRRAAPVQDRERPPPDRAARELRL